MKGKASDICTKCKHCEGSVDIVEKSYYVCGESHSDGGLYHLMPAEDELYCTSYEEETNMNKVEGKVGDFCLNCKNCKAVTRMHDGETASIRIIEVDCEDPYDGMVKTLDADSDICCSMFEPKPPCEKCERFDGSYCHSPKMPREALEAKILDLFEEKNRLNGIINSLEKEKAAHLKGIERLKKSQEKLQNQIKNLQTTNEESYKREEKLEDKVHKLERRLLEENKKFARLDSEFLIPLGRVLYPREAKICKPYSEVLEDIKLLNNRVFMLEADNIRLTEKNNALFEENLNRLDKHTKQRQEIDNLRSKLISLNTINKGLAEDRKKLINYIRSLKIASENYLKEFTYEED